MLPYFGHISTALAILAGVPMLVAGATDNYSALWRYLVVIALLLAICIPLMRRPRPSDLQVNEGLVITATVFILAPLIMAFPLAAHGLTYGQALFEAVSAITTTGLSTLASVENRPASFLFARAWMQWYGGLGIVALLPLWIPPGPAARRFVGLDQPEGDDPLTSARFYARRIIGVYLALTAGGVLLLWLLGSDPFTALVHTLAAVSTGGFSNFDANLAGLGRPAAVGTVLLSVLGALPFMLYLQAMTGRVRSIWTDVQVRSLLLFGLLGGVVLALMMPTVAGENLLARFTDAGLLAFSAQTTAGFTSIDIGSLGAGAKYVLILMMIAGGGLGSTAGGIKLIRILIFFKLLRALIQRASLPQAAWFTPQLGGMTLSEEITQRSLLLILMFVATVAISWLPFVAAGEEPLDALFEVVSATATVGLSAGVTRTDLAPVLQGILCLDMWLGRLEMVALLVLLSPAAWRHHRETRV